MYKQTNIWTHHKLHNSNENKIPVFPECICNKWQNMMCICVPTACARRPCGALGDLTALLLRCRCDPTAFARRSFRSPWERRATARTLCMHKVRAVPWRPRRPHGVQWRCHGDATAIHRRSRRSHYAHLGVLNFSCTPCSRREDATLVWQGL